MADDTSADTGVERDRQILAEAKRKGGLATLGAYIKLSGPGWLQSAITLGGGSLSASLYLGVLAGFSLLWLQPLAMIIGVIMLSAIAYVTLSTGERPFQAINKHVNPVLGWGWLIATLMANCVWALPQFGLAYGSMSQNLLPGVFGPGAMDPTQAKWIVSGSIAVLCLVVVFCYDGGGKAVKFFDILLKLMVAVIVVSFIGVVVYMTAKGALDWGRVGNGLIPDLRMLWTPAATFNEALAAAGEFKNYWAGEIVSEQQDVLVAAAATAVGINMTFLLPYSMLKKGWNRQFRGLATFDLSTGLFIPFILATGCVVIASASQFHTQPAIPFPADDAAVTICALPAGEADAEKIQAEVAKAYKACVTKEAKEAFPPAAAKAVTDAMAQAGFAALPTAEKQAAIKAALVAAGEGKLKDPDGKLADGYVKIAMERFDEGMGDKAADAKKILKPLADAVAEAEKAEDDAKIKAAKKALLKAQMKLLDSLPLADRKIAAMLVRRDSIHLSKALSPLTGDVMADYVFGIGVIGMAVSSIIILMLINGFCICEMLDKPSRGWLYRFGCMIPAVGMLGPIIWDGAKPYLAIPTSVFGFIVIPIAYTTFALVLNQRKLLGDNMPKGLGRWIWNLFMLVGVLAVAIGSAYMAWKSTRNLPGIFSGGWVGPTGIGVFITLAVVVHFIRRANRNNTMP